MRMAIVRTSAAVGMDLRMAQLLLPPLCLLLGSRTVLPVRMHDGGDDDGVRRVWSS